MINKMTADLGFRRFERRVCVTEQYILMYFDEIILLNVFKFDYEVNSWD